jgi:hypothetical protein
MTATHELSPLGGLRMEVTRPTSDDPAAGPAEIDRVGA